MSQELPLGCYDKTCMFNLIQFNYLFGAKPQQKSSQGRCLVKKVTKQKYKYICVFSVFYT